MAFVPIGPSGFSSGGVEFEMLTIQLPPVRARRLHARVHGSYLSNAKGFAFLK